MDPERDFEAPDGATTEPDADEARADVRVSDPEPATSMVPDDVSDEDASDESQPAVASSSAPSVWDRLQPASEAADDDETGEPDVRASDPDPQTTVTADVVDEADEPDEPEAATDTEAAEDEEAEEEEDEEPSFLFQVGEWFVVHTYAGYENKVKANLASRISSMNMEDKIHEVVVPTEEVMELKSGKMQAVQKKVFPGYILVRMDLDDDSWYVVRNTPGVTGFVGSGAKPTPLEYGEVQSILAPKAEERPRLGVQFEVSEVVNVTMGPFAGMTGPIAEINEDQRKVKVLVNIFGRETPVELGFDQVTKL